MASEVQSTLSLPAVTFGAGSGTASEARRGRSHKDESLMKRPLICDRACLTKQFRGHVALGGQPDGAREQPPAARAILGARGCASIGDSGCGPGDRAGASSVLPGARARQKSGIIDSTRIALSQLQRRSQDSARPGRLAISDILIPDVHGCAFAKYSKSVIRTLCANVMGPWSQESSCCAVFFARQILDLIAVQAIRSSICYFLEAAASLTRSRARLLRAARTARQLRPICQNVMRPASWPQAAPSFACSDIM